MGASSQAGYEYPPAPDHLGPRTSSSQCCGDTGWVHSGHIHHTGVQTPPAVWAAVHLLPRLLQGCALVPADTGFCSPLSGTSKAECHLSQTRCSQMLFVKLGPQRSSVDFYSFFFSNLRHRYESQGCSSVEKNACRACNKSLAQKFKVIFNHEFRISLTLPQKKKKKTYDF